MTKMTVLEYRQRELLAKKELAKLGSNIMAEEHVTVMADLYHRINNEHKRPLHKGQVALARAVFTEKKRIIQAQWGRNGAKSESACYIAWVKAMLTPNSRIYIICPQRKQGGEIYWASGRIKNYGPQQYLKGEPNKSEFRLEFKNGSFICIEGAENYAALRGIKPDLVIYDEFQDHIKEFDVEVMRPNLLAKTAVLVVLGTPPKRDCYYYEFKKRLQHEIAKGDDTRCYLQFPTSINPSIDAAELKKIRAALIAQGDEAVWKREYMGEDCIGGAEMIFPLWSRKEHMKPHRLIMDRLSLIRNECRFATVFDPGTTSTFGVLFLAFNPHTCTLYLLDEIYEKDRRRMDTASIWAIARRKERELAPHIQWLRVADEAAAWFRREMIANFSVAISPSRKQRQKKDLNISVLKSLQATDDAFQVSERCAFFAKEIENYSTDENGNFPSDNDHLLDCLDYSVPILGIRTRQKMHLEQYRHSFKPGENRTTQVKELNLKIDDWAEEIFNDSLTNDPLLH